MHDSELKKCSRCCERKNVDEFYKNRSTKDGLNNYCKKCFNIIQSTDERKKKRNRTNIDNGIGQKRYSYFRGYNLNRSYGITQAEYEKMVSEQKNVCAICGKNGSECRNGLYVDHDHSSKKVRKLLCQNCNSGVGNFKDDPKLLRIAADYLDENNSIRRKP